VADVAAYDEFRSQTPSRFLDLPSTEVFGLDGAAVAKARAAGPAASAAAQLAVQADQTGDRRTLAADSLIAGALAVIYLGFVVYFALIGGYRRVELSG